MGGIVETNIGARGMHLPRGEGEAADVYVGSPLAIIGLWVLALRERFNANLGEPLPWVWRANLRPDDAENGEPLPEAPRNLVIESAYNVEKAHRNYRPAIYVGRGRATATKIAVDNRAGNFIPTGFKAHYGHVTMPIIFDCESENSAESTTIAETAWGFVLATRDIFRSSFGLHDIVEPALEETTPGALDKNTWTTQVAFNVVYEQRWGTRPIAPVLREIAAQLEAGTSDGGTTLQQLAARDISHP
jgi:hypothetical protein